MRRPDRESTPLLWNHHAVGLSRQATTIAAVIVLRRAAVVVSP